jgi:NitT/TauT family transport system substrate-binding protein
MKKKRSDERDVPSLDLLPDNPDVADGMPDPKLDVGSKLVCDSQYDHLGSLLKTGISRRTLLKASLGAVAAFGGALPAMRAFAEKKFDPVVRIGYLPITDAAALLIAHEMGFLKKEGLDSERPVLVRGWSQITEAFQAHKFNLVHLLNPIPIWMRYNNKFPVKITAWDHTNGSALVVGAHTGIQSFKDFGGKQLAVPYWYSNHNIIAQMLLRDAGITPVIRPQEAKLAPNECNLLVLAPPDMPPALAAKKIDAYIVAEPFNALGEIKAGAKMLRFTGDVWKGHPCCVVAMHEADVMDPARAAWTQGVHNAIVAAQLFMAENRKETAKILSKDGKNYLPFPFEVIDRAMNFYDPAYYKNPLAIKHVEWQQSRINFQAWPYDSATKIVTEELKKVVLTGDRAFMDNLSADFVAKDLVNYDFIRKSLEKNPTWRKDLSVPQAGDPYTRQEVIKV